MPGSNPSAGLEVLTANRNYYVRTDGSDLNNGSTNTAGGAFLTINRALRAANLCIQDNFKITVNVADGTYPESVRVGGVPGKSSTVFPYTLFALIGNISNPGNVIINSIYGSNTTMEVAGFTILNGINCSVGSNFYVHACRTSTLYSGTGSFMYAEVITVIAGPYSDSFATTYHGVMELYNIIVSAGLTFTQGFANALGGIIEFDDQPVGTTIGPKFKAQQNGVINTYGGGLAYLPGSVAGTLTSGGQYV